MSLKKTLTCFVVTGSILGSGFVQAEEPAGTTLETITVTAEKREENIQDVPTSITAFLGGDLDDAGIETLGEISRFVPNVYLSQDYVIIRGISQYYGSRNSSVGFYLDGVSLPYSGVYNSELFDIERVEVLKGPQGTLYGRNTEAGVINIITRQAENELSGKLVGEYSFYDADWGTSPAYHVGGNINAPLVADKLFLRLTGKWLDDKGYIKNVYDNDDEYGRETEYNGRLNLKWLPNDRWDVSLIGDIMKRDTSEGAYFKYLTGPLFEGRNQVSMDGPNSFEMDGNGQTLSIKYAGEGYELLSITGRRSAEQDLDSDFDLTSLAAFASLAHFTDDYVNYSQEIRLSSTENNSSFKWLVGVYAFDEEMDVYEQKIFPNFFQSRDTISDGFGYAAFGQGTYTFMERLHLTAGLRYDYSEYDGKQTLTKGSQPLPGFSKDSTYSNDFDNSEFLPKLSAVYDFTDNVMGYASVAQGYLSGGYNYKWGNDADSLIYDPEYTWNYEIGMKSTWLDQRLLTNIALFYIDMKDKQVSEWDPTTGYVSTIRNAANAYSAGMELDLQARLAQGLDLFGGFGYTSAKIDDWLAWEYDYRTGAVSQYDYSDKHLPNVPEYTFNLGLQYRHLSGFFGRVDLLGTGSLYSDAKNSAKEEANQLVNLRLGYEQERYDIIVWCKNLLNEEYYQVKMTSGNDFVGVEGEPRMVGLTLRYRF